MNKVFSGMRDICFRVYNKIMQKMSNFLFRDILTTPSVKTDQNAKTVLYSALNNVNVNAYILAAKSFLRFCPNVSVVVQDDGDLTEQSKRAIREHIDGVIIYSRESMFDVIDERINNDVKQLLPSKDEYFQFTPIRILYLKCISVIARFPERKVIFMDSDMIFIRPPEFIIKWIDDESCGDFYGEGGSYLAKRFHGMGFPFKTLDISNFNSGLIGLAYYGNQESLANTLRVIREKDPGVMYEWEIEQSVWSVLMSERDNPVNLDSLRDVYIGSGWRSFDDLVTNAIVAHFVGAIRFKNFRYLRLARKVVSELKESYSRE